MNIYKFILNRILGWKIVGDFKEKELKKAVIIVCPHTSWHDFYIAILCRKTLGVMINFVGKKELYKIPLFGYIYKRAAIMVDRSDSKSRFEVYGQANEMLK